MVTHKNNMKFLTVTEVVFLGYFSMVYAASYINEVIVKPIANDVCSDVLVSDRLTGTGEKGF